VAAKLCVVNRTLQLYSGGPKLWRYEPNGVFASIERTVLSVYEREGWSGHDGLGFLMLSLIKAASFKLLPDELNSTFIESLYHWGFYYDDNGQQQTTSVPDMLECVCNATAHQIAKNFSVMTVTGFGTRMSPQTVANNTEKALGLFKSLGAERLHSIATVFSEAPYDLRSGWPSLTLWHQNTVAFRLVKSPGNTLTATQKRLISKLLLPLGFDVEIVKVAHASAIESVTTQVAAPENMRGFTVPGPPKTVDPFSLNINSIEAKLAETNTISEILNNIFAEKDSEAISSPILSDSVPIAGLDLESFSFMKTLSTKVFWTREELEKIAAEHRLMLDGTLDSINDASYSHFGSPFFEGDDPIEIDREIASRLSIGCCK